VEPLRPTDPQVIGRYRLTGRLGAGGMGRVYLGITPEGRRAAVKVIRDDLADDPAFRARFRREVSAAVSVAGIFTARLLDADPDGDPPWLATQFVEGASLRDTVESGGPLPVEQLIPLAQGLCDALGSIHAAGLVHRDLKPANVLLSPTGARVIDFGIARRSTSTRVTMTGEVIGTPDFMSPEQVAGTPVTPASDVFALGATLVYAATGHGPFAADQAAATLFRIMQAAPELAAVPDPIADLAAACLAKDPAARPTLPELGATLRTLSPERAVELSLTGPTRPIDLRRTGPLAPAQLAAAETLDPASLRDIAAVRSGGTTSPPSRWRGRRPLALAVVAAAVVVAGGATTLGIMLGRGGSGGPVGPLTTTPTASVPASASVDTDDPRYRYVNRLCGAGTLLVDLAKSSPQTTATGDPGVAKREFLSATARMTATIDVALADYVPLRDEAPTPEVRLAFDQIVEEFTRARTAMTEARATVDASEPLTNEAYAAGVDRFTDGVRSVALVVPLMQQITLPKEYTAMSAVAPNCVSAPPSN
jgi:serine/threonine protein kinase